MLFFYLSFLGCASFPIQSRDEACGWNRWPGGILSLPWCFPVGELHIRRGGGGTDKRDGSGCVEYVPVWSKKAGQEKNLFKSLLGCKENLENTYLNNKVPSLTVAGLWPESEL